jgi:ATP-binding cassette subfamily C protein CydD/ATP-binding cassette subfamily C protein CydCD
LLRNARATRGFLAATVAIGAGAAVLVVAQATLLATGIADVVAGQRLPGSLLTALALVVAGRAVLAWAQEQAATRAAATVKSQLRQRLLAHVVRLGPGWLSTRRSGELTTLATRGLDALDGYFARYLPQVVLAGLVPAVVLARILPADTVAFVIVLVTLPLIPVFMALVGWTTEARNRRQFAVLARLSHHFLDVVAGLPTLKAYRRATAQVRTIRAVTEEYRRATMGTLRLAFLSSLVLELLATLSVALVAVSIGLRLVDGGLDLRTALLVLVLAPEAYLPLRALGTQYHAAAEGLAAAESVFAVLSEAPRSSGVLPVSGGPLVLSDVTVRFPDRNGPALERFSLTVSPGEIVALTGPSGCGKSTVLHALLGFVAAESGSVSLGGVALSEADPKAWRACFAWVPQRPYLTAGTVGANIALGLSTVDSAQLASAAAAAELDVPLSTVVGDRGAGLSAGQRQRVALARAYLRDAPVLLLDEPTANLDAATESRLVATLRELLRGRTALIVAHHPVLLDLADRVVDLSRVTGVTLDALPAAERA